MNSIITLHGYFMLNAALIIGYVITRALLRLPFFNKKLLQSQQLKFARYLFMTAIGAFYMGPVISRLFPAANDSGFKLEPIVKIVTSPFTHTQQFVAEQITHAGSHYSFPSITAVIATLLIAGITISLVKYIRDIINLNKIGRNSYCHHNINNIQILFNHTTAIPFCWSLFRNHYVVIPSSFLDKSEDLKLAIRHELQHIRQLDTVWLHIISIAKVICFWNPVIKLWMKLFDELQEFSCDETLMLRKKTSASAYAQCLVDAASGLFESRVLPQGALGIHGFSTSILYRRVNMLFDYTPLKQKKLPLLIAYAVTAAITASTSIAFASSSTLAPLSTQQVEKLIKQSNINEEFQVTANREVVNELNNIRSSEQARSYMQASLQRMQHHLPLVNDALAKRGMPKDLSVIPLVESGYQPLEESKNPVKAAGIWQIIPATATRLGLTVNANNDQRMDMPLATQAALTLLSEDHKIYNNWKLAFMAYEIGEKATDDLIKSTGSRDAWVLANSPKAPPALKKILAAFDAELIIMHNPSLVNANS